MIYFLQAGRHGPIKIGYTTDWEKRFSQMKTANPEPLHLLKLMSGRKSKETYFHCLFADHRKRGEWFYPASLIFDHIKISRGSFRHFCFHLSVEDNPRGDFIGDVRRDPWCPYHQAINTPNLLAIDDLISYLQFKGACDEALEQARLLWHEYERWRDAGENFYA
jgi:Meiotically up-regulated gene 113